MKGNSPLFLCKKKEKAKKSGLLLKTTSLLIRFLLHSVPDSTITQKDDQGNIIRIRHYDEHGNAYKDVDYTDHGRPDIHKVPHTRIIEIGNIINRKIRSETKCILRTLSN